VTLGLYFGSRLLVSVVPDPSGLYRVNWPDREPSDIANLSRCCDAAREWAERSVLLDRKQPVARHLKSLANFSWRPLPVRRKAGA